jgi:hypothetical protein
LLFLLFLPYLKKLKNKLFFLTFSNYAFWYNTTQRTQDTEQNYLKIHPDHSRRGKALSSGSSISSLQPIDVVAEVVHLLVECIQTLCMRLGCAGATSPLRIHLLK